MRWSLLVAAAMMAGCLSGPSTHPPEAPWSNPLIAPEARVRVQLDHVPGRAPSTFALDALVDVMGEVGTPGSVQVKASLPENGGPYSDADLLALHASTYEASPTTWRDDHGTPVLHALYVDGNSSRDSSTQTLYGAAYAATGYPLIVIFHDRLPTHSLWRASLDVPMQAPEGYERAVLLHEYGHALGLVGCGLPEVKPHQNASDPCHSTNKRSAMFPYMHNADDVTEWALDDQGQPVWRFDEDDWADIRRGQADLPTASALTGWSRF